MKFVMFDLNWLAHASFVMNAFAGEVSSESSHNHIIIFCIIINT